MHNPEAMGATAMAGACAGGDPALRSDAQRRFHRQSHEELLGLGLALNRDDACDILARLSIRDFVERTISTVTGELMYVFTPRVAGISLYVKLILRRRCVVISFHEQDKARDGEDV
jgi:hypothetical protein